MTFHVHCQDCGAGFDQVAATAPKAVALVQKHHAGGEHTLKAIPYPEPA